MVFLFTSRLVLVAGFGIDAQWAKRTLDRSQSKIFLLYIIIVILFILCLLFTVLHDVGYDALLLLCNKAINKALKRVALLKSW